MLQFSLPRAAPQTRGQEECYFGKTPLYVMMAGKGAIENAAGVLQNVVGPGDLVGEGGALGLAPKRMSKATLRRPRQLVAILAPRHSRLWMAARRALSV